MTYAYAQSSQPNPALRNEPGKKPRTVPQKESASDFKTTVTSLADKNKSELLEKAKQILSKGGSAPPPASTSGAPTPAPAPAPMNWGAVPTAPVPAAAPMPAAGSLTSPTSPTATPTYPSGGAAGSQVYTGFQGNTNAPPPQQPASGGWNIKY